MPTLANLVRVLGPIHAEFAGNRVRPSRRRERTLLALLALEAGQPVPLQRLASLLLGDRPLDSARAAIQTCVSRLRASLIAADAAEYGVTVVRDGGDGYAIRMPRDWVDAYRFTELLAEAHAAPRPCERRQLLRDALGLWRGPALADVDPRVRQVVGTGWELRRRSALQARIECDLEFGATDDLVAELIELVAAEPLSEPLAGLLMRALYGCGQRGGALEAFRRTRDRLAEELGIEPGDELQELHRCILEGRKPAALGSPNRWAVQASPGQRRR